MNNQQKFDGFEIRDIAHYGDVKDTEIRAVPNDPNKIVGYFAVYNSLSADLGGFKERIQPGAFRRALSSGQDIRALVGHDPNLLLGRTSNGTLRLSEDAIGLRAEIDLPDTSYARDVKALLVRGDIKGGSFGFKVFEGGQKFNRDSTGLMIRDLTDLNLGEVSTTPKPAYGDTAISIRSAVIDPAVMKEFYKPKWIAAKLKCLTTIIE